MRAERATRGSVEGTLASQEKEGKDWAGPDLDFFSSLPTIIYLPPMGQNINTEV